jgi:hypothetical protein
MSFRDGTDIINRGSGPRSGCLHHLEEDDPVEHIEIAALRLRSDTPLARQTLPRPLGYAMPQRPGDRKVPTSESSLYE